MSPYNDAEQSPESVYDDLLTRGVYTEAELEPEDRKRIYRQCQEDHAFAKSLRQLPNPSYRILFSTHYAVLRSLASLMLSFEKTRSETGQGAFLFLILHFKELEFDWQTLESLRLTQEGYATAGKDITLQQWKRAELQFELYINALRSEIEKRLGTR